MMNIIECTDNSVSIIEGREIMVDNLSLKDNSNNIINGLKWYKSKKK
jgi:hypothetical protein